MYAVIRVGTSQERVTEGQLVRVDKRAEENGAVIEFEPVLLVDGDSVLAGPALEGAKVTGTIVGVQSGPKIRALTYKAKSIQRKRWGHRQWYTTVEINKIAAKPAKAAKTAKVAAATEA
ncbi:MAG: 50S ribosomal protein L21 [Acidobacteriota bacterium]|nr:50S ribosomal protein L21 [Acidobacteriota bacterium]MDE3031893.1 50S ribosomal protein L21 [Acidobacteriota bacterium]MDE3092911.1 50S ribosomal protein L21 [Acidobacteriota bacterium]MDE3138457.1 50S ribosomal protein L21 [Acidobacteriota bacterium]MDE3146590.1 50S ribosomal protein L21 [Acidobacteriota bacterium]